MSEAVVVTALFTPAPGRRQAVLDAVTAILADVHAEPGCQFYAIHEGDDDTLIMIEKWDSQADLDVHSDAAAVKVLRKSLEGLLAEPINVKIWKSVPGGDSVKGAL